MFELKSLHKDAITPAIEKAVRYRLLNEASAAESICLDILHIDPQNQEVVKHLILSLTDQFADTVQRINIKQPQDLLKRLTSEYDRVYYHGIICERWAKAVLARGNMGAGEMAYGFLLEAMDLYDKAEGIRETGNDDAILRWNSCVRFMSSHKLVAPTGANDSSTHYHD